MSWSAHQFEGYVLQKHFGSRVRISYLAIVAGDLVPDAFVKLYVYGFTFRGHHYGAKDPSTFHRGWPGAGFTHSLAFGALVAALVWWKGRDRPWGVPWGIGILIGQWAHVLTDINDSKGTMLLFPFTTHSFSVGAWAYAAQVGKHQDAAAYFSSLGLAMDVLWLLVLACYAPRVLSRRYFEQVVRPSDSTVWDRAARRLPDDALLALYRGLFAFALARLVAWTTWSHTRDPHPFDLSWGGPSWVRKVPPSEQSWGWALVGALAVGVALLTVSRLVLRRHRLPGYGGERDGAAP